MGVLSPEVSKLQVLATTLHINFCSGSESGHQHLYMETWSFHSYLICPMTSIPDNQELQAIPDCDFVPLHNVCANCSILFI